mmetsp:Transcript_13881/g.41300  ORF Transcript_13881/g.41300 Transcript_13881/m.41300 type:complete len:243 (-) Transcript_13881:21-749(-)
MARRCLVRPLDRSDIATWWPNLWQHSTAASSASTASASASVGAAPPEYSSNRHTTACPCTCVAICIAAAHISEAMKDTSSVLNMQIKLSSTAQAWADLAALQTPPAMAVETTLAAPTPPSSMARSSQHEPSGSKASAAQAAAAPAPPASSSSANAEAPAPSSPDAVVPSHESSSDWPKLPQVVEPSESDELRRRQTPRTGERASASRAQMKVFLTTSEVDMARKRGGPWVSARGHGRKWAWA